MAKYWPAFFLPLTLGLLLLAFTKINHLFVKRNEGFSLHHIYSSLQERPEWNIAIEQDIKKVIPLLDQKFYYLKRGHQTYAFISADQKYVLKFYRFPSHMRKFSWATSPLSYFFGSSREETTRYNWRKLEDSFSSYKLAREELAEESGLLYVHLNPTKTLQQKVQLIDRLGKQYEIDLDRTHCILQRKGNLLFPLLEKFKYQNDRIGIQKVTSGLIQLIAKRIKKGIEDKDEVLHKNYGW